MQDSKNLGMYLSDIIHWIDKIEEKSAKLFDFENYSKDQDLQDIIERRLSRITEAARKIPKEWRQKHPEVPWEEIVGMGSVLRHNYDSINPKIVWNTVRTSLTPLKMAVVKLLVEHEKSDHQKTEIPGHSPPKGNKTRQR